MASEQDINFSIHADVPKENLQVLDTVLTELFGALSTNMKKAGDFLEKMKPPQVETEPKEEKNTEESGDDDGEETQYEEDDDDEEEEEEEETDGEQECEEEGYDSDNEKEDIEHVFLVNIDGEVLGYSPTLRQAMSCLNQECEDFLYNYQGLFRVQRTTTSVQVFRRTPYLWYMFSEQPIFQGEIQVVTKV
jgi:hypothetical protein